MKAKKCFITALAVLPLFGLAGQVQGDPCIRSCTSHLYVYLTYQPEGQVNTEKKTDMLKTTKKLSRDGRAGNNCLPHNILKAKQLGCSEAVRDLVRLHRSGDRQRQTVCEAVQYGETLIPRSNVQDEIYPKADWYRIDRMEAKAQRDAIRLRAEIDTIDHRRFRCTDGRAVVLQAGGPAPHSGTDAAPPPPPRVGTPAPPPPPSETARPAPPPPPSHKAPIASAMAAPGSRKIFRAGSFASRKMRTACFLLRSALAARWLSKFRCGGEFPNARPVSCTRH